MTAKVKATHIWHSRSGQGDLPCRVWNGGRPTRTGLIMIELLDIRVGRYPFRFVRQQDLEAIG